MKTRTLIKTKHEILEEKEFSSHILNPRIISHIEEFRKTANLKKEDVKILDWGCGRGADTLWLRKKGYSAFGVDVDKEVIDNGNVLLDKHELPIDTLSLLSENGNTNFPDDYFHFTFSDQVFEHVDDINKVVIEIKRITKDGGEGYHIFPSHRSIMEGHLYMPMVHWLPKNNIRKLLVFLFVLFGIEPNWDELRNLNVKEKTNKYYLYLHNKTFYRNTKKYKKLFTSNGFSVSFETINNPRINKYKFLTILIKLKILKRLISWILINCRSVELQLKRNKSITSN